MKGEEEIRLELEHCEEQMNGLSNVLSSRFGSTLTKRSNKNILSMREQLFERAFALRWVLGEYEKKPKRKKIIV
jgi:predicted nuclease of restriction endonuclease-like RecB superfamily